MSLFKISLGALAGITAAGAVGYVYGKPALDTYVDMVAAPKIALARTQGFAAGVKVGTKLGRTNTIRELQPVREREKAEARRQVVQLAQQKLERMNSVVMRQNERLRVVTLQASRPQKCVERIALIGWSKEKPCA